jgi:hypothetical protein
MGRLLKSLLILALVLLIGLFITGFWAGRHYDVSPRVLMIELLRRAGFADHRVEGLLAPSQRYAARALDGAVRQNHPRILLPELAAWNGSGVAPLMAQRLALHKRQGTRLDAYPACGRRHAMSHVVCWLSTGRESEARQALDLLVKAQIVPPELGSSGGDSWEWALAFDLLALYPGMSHSEREIIVAKLSENLARYLHLLDGESASLWHGRSSLAAQAWLLAVVLDGEAGYDVTLTRRAQGHFQETLGALVLTEAWPEGYNYWINNRALLIVLAAAAWVNGLEQSRFTPTVLHALRRAGLWTVYATRPDNRIEALGDEGPRVDLKDETRRAIDVMAQLTGDSVFSTYSHYLDKLHGEQSYYRAFRWSFLLFNDPAVEALPGVTVGELRVLESYLPAAELFGAGAMNLLIARSGWGADDTFVSARAGHTFTHHGHYDAGHFTLFKGAPLASNSSIYNDFFSPHRIYYGLRSVAKNSLLVVRPGDDIPPHHLIENNINDGGQRLVMPTGSAVRGIDHWRSQLGAGGHYEGAQLLDYQLREGSFVYLKADLTGAYDSVRHDTQGKGGKVSLVIRELLYLFEEDRLLVRDQVVSTDPSYSKKWLLHTVTKPNVESARVILGSEAAGVLESDNDLMMIQNGSGRLDVKRLLPEAAVVRLVGGEGYQYYVASDGAGSGTGVNRNGDNFSAGAQARPWFDNGTWRLEIRPPVPRERDEFLVALSPSLGLDRSAEVSSLHLLSGHGSAVETPERLILFVNGGVESGELSFEKTGNQQVLLIVGVVLGEEYRLVLGDETVQYNASRSGVLRILLPTAFKRGEVVVLRRN